MKGKGAEEPNNPTRRRLLDSTHKGYFLAMRSDDDGFLGNYQRKLLNLSKSSIFVKTCKILYKYVKKKNLMATVMPTTNFARLLQHSKPFFARFAANCCSHSSCSQNLFERKIKSFSVSFCQPTINFFHQLYKLNL